MYHENPAARHSRLRALLSIAAYGEFEFLFECLDAPTSSGLHGDTAVDVLRQFSLLDFSLAPELFEVGAEAVGLVAHAAQVLLERADVGQDDAALGVHALPLAFYGGQLAALEVQLGVQRLDLLHLLVDLRLVRQQSFLGGQSLSLGALVVLQASEDQRSALALSNQLHTGNSRSAHPEHAPASQLAPHE